MGRAAATALLLPRTIDEGVTGAPHGGLSVSPVSEPTSSDMLNALGSVNIGDCPGVVSVAGDPDSDGCDDSVAGMFPDDDVGSDNAGWANTSHGLVIGSSGVPLCVCLPSTNVSFGAVLVVGEKPGNDSVVGDPNVDGPDDSVTVVIGPNNGCGCAPTAHGLVIGA